MIFCFGISDNISTPENWTSKTIDDIFLNFNKQLNLTIDKYILFGHSAGAQFTHRALMFSESNYLDFAIAANAGTYTFPDLNTNYMNGMRNVFPFHKNLIHRNYGRGLYVLTLQMRNTTSATFSGGQYAAALLDNDGNIISVLGTGGSGSLSAGNRHTSTRNINCTVSPNSVPIGNYHLRILVRPNTTDGVWHIATLADTDVPDSIDFEVK